MTKEQVRRLSSLVSLGLSWEEAHKLRRASMTLSRWSELECGDGNDYGSWAIERDDQIGYRLDSQGSAEDPGHVPTDKPYMVHHHYRHGQGADSVTRTPIPDREKGALKRVKAICDAHGLYFYHQTDPRGAALYISREPLTDSTYTKGVAVYK